MRPPPDSNEDKDKKLFVGGLNPKTDEESLRSYYSQYGEITDVVVMKDPKSSKSRGFGFVTFKDAESVDKAQACRPHTLDGKEVDSKRAMPRDDTSPEVHATVKKIFVGGLRKEITNADLSEYFGKYGNVTDASVVTAKDTNTSRGFAFVTFDDTDCVDKVILARPHTICGHKADVRKALSRDEMSKLRTKSTPTRVDYGWGDAPNPSYTQNWDQGYAQNYGYQQQYGYDNTNYGYGNYDNTGGNGWPTAPPENFGSYPQQAYSGGPIRTPPNPQYARPGPYANNGWQQR